MRKLAASIIVGALAIGAIAFHPTIIEFAKAIRQQIVYISTIQATLSPPFFIPIGYFC